MRGILILVICWLAGLEIAAAQNGPLPIQERALSAFSKDPNRQFDFWIGDWDVLLRIRQEDLSWADRVRARAKIYSILKGKAILELWGSERIKGFSLRYYDPAEEKWVLWLNWPGRNASRLSSLEGAFRHGRGDFFSEFDTPEGQHIVARYSFNDITANTLRWDDHYSSDGGKTWSPNWIMEWRRRAAEPEWPLPDPAPTYADGSRCETEPFRAYEGFAGDWLAVRPPRDQDASLHMRKVLDGCAVLGTLKTGELEWFVMVTYLGGETGWAFVELADKSGEPLEVFYAKEATGQFVSASGARRIWQLSPKGELTIDMRDADGVPIRDTRLRKQ